MQSAILSGLASLLLTSTPAYHAPLAPGDVEYRDELATRYMAATTNILTRPDRYPISSFRSNITGEPGALWVGWPGDQVGRWFTLLRGAQAKGWTPAARSRAEVAEAVLPLQNHRGDLGPALSIDQKDGRVPSGHAFALRGMVDAYLDTGEARYLEAARGLARYFEQAAPTWREAENGGLHCFYGHCLDGLVALYEVGGDTWALDLARALSRHVGRSGHTHHSLSMCRGVLDLYRVTGDPEVLARAEDYLTWCRESRTVSGGLPEAMPASAQDEGCGLSDYIVASLMAYSVTGQIGYLDDAERTLTNHFFMNQFHTGGFGHRGFGQEVVGGKEWQGWDGAYGSENPGCCSLWGQWALGQLGRWIVTTEGDRVEVNLYPQAVVHLRERGVRIEIASDFPRTRRATLTLAAERPERFALALRVPAWAEEVVAVCDGRRYAGAEPGRLVIDRVWQGTETVEVTFRSGLRIERGPAGDPPLGAVFDGPVCLALSSATADVSTIRRIRVEPDGRPEAGPEGVVLAYGAAGDQYGYPLAPLADDWLSPDVNNPNRLRILFELSDSR